MNTKKKINLYKLKESKKWFRSFRKEVFEYLGDSLYEITNEQEFLFRVMKGIYPLNRSVKNENKSLETACKKLFSVLKIRKGNLYEIDADGKYSEIISEPEETTSFKKFFANIPVIRDPPWNYLQTTRRRS